MSDHLERVSILANKIVSTKNEPNQVLAHFDELLDYFADAFDPKEATVEDIAVIYDSGRFLKSINNSNMFSIESLSRMPASAVPVAVVRELFSVHKINANTVNSKNLRTFIENYRDVILGNMPKSPPPLSPPPAF